MKVVLDSNVLLVAIGKRSRYRPIWNAFIEGKYQLILSDEILYEYQEILERHSPPGAAEIVTEIFVESPDVITQNVYYNWNVIKDPDDNKFFDVAVAANADYIVTNDAHFKAATSIKFPKVTIINAEAFLLVLETLK